MKVLHLTESFPPIHDATAAAVFGCASALSQMDVHCDVAMPMYPDIPRGLDFHIHTYHSLGMAADGEYPLGFPHFPGTVDKLLRLTPDVIHVHTPFASMALARRLRKKLKRPVILSFHSKYSHDVERFVTAAPLRGHVNGLALKALRDADEVWIPAPGVSKEMARIGYSGGHYVMENGVDMLSSEPDVEQISELKTRYNIAHNEPVLLFSGRMVWHKNIRLIIDALRLLQTQDFGFKMLFVGDGIDRAAMEDYAASQKLGGLVSFVGHVSDVNHLRAFYDLSDLLLCPSMTDNAPPAVAEAAACGLPALLVRGSDASYKVEDGVSGFLSDSEPIEFAAAIHTALSDRRLLRRVGAAARSKLYMPWEHAADKMLKRYQVVCRLFDESK